MGLLHIDFQRLMEFQQEHLLAEAVLGVVIVSVCFLFRHSKWIGWLWLAAVLPAGGYTIYSFLMLLSCVVAFPSESAALSVTPLAIYSWPPVITFIGLVVAYPRGPSPRNGS